MTDSLIAWHVYQISSDSSSLNGVGLRGTIRKLALERGFNVISENTEDAENGVRFAVIDDAHAEIIRSYVLSIIADAQIEKVLDGVHNPVVSKIKVNDESRYTL